MKFNYVNYKRGKCKGCGGNPIVFHNMNNYILNK